MVETRHLLEKKKIDKTDRCITDYIPVTQAASEKVYVTVITFLTDEQSEVGKGDQYMVGTFLSEDKDSFIIVKFKKLNKFTILAS